MARVNYSIQEILQAIQIDEFRMFAWKLLGGSAPDKLSDTLLGREPQREIRTFNTGEDFEKAWKGGN